MGVHVDREAAEIMPNSKEIPFLNKQINPFSQIKSNQYLFEDPNIFCNICYVKKSSALSQSVVAKKS